MALSHLHNERMQIADQLEMANVTKVENLVPLWEYQVASQFSQLVNFEVGLIQAIFDKSTLTSETRSMKMTAINCVDPAGIVDRFILLIDTAIYYGDMTPKINQLFDRAIRRQTIEVKEQFVAARPTILDELSDVHTIFFGTGSDRWKKLKALNHYVLIPSLTHTANGLIYWELGE